MSRSRRKTPITGWTMALSEKDDKRRYNRTLRRLNRERLTAFGEEAPRGGREGESPGRCLRTL